MAYGQDEMKVTCGREEILGILRKNRDSHKIIVEEARKGYIEKAKVALEERLKQLAEGKVASLGFSLTPPQDHTREYNTTIKMLELHQGETITLTASQFENYVEDRWEWKNHFLATSAVYSATAAVEAARGDE